MFGHLIENTTESSSFERFEQCASMFILRAFALTGRVREEQEVRNLVQRLGNVRRVTS